MIGFLNLGSLVLGLVALILPVVNLTLYKKHDHRNWITLSVMSISACAVSLYFQILYSYHLVKLADWSALMDTTDAVVFVAAALLIITIILNAITLLVYRNKIAKKN
jgi:cytochrome c oxidase subunit 4